MLSRHCRHSISGLSRSGRVVDLRIHKVGLDLNDLFVWQGDDGSIIDHRILRPSEHDCAEIHLQSLRRQLGKSFLHLRNVSEMSTAIHIIMPSSAIATLTGSRTFS